jgi:hypothetical protein
MVWIVGWLYFFKTWKRKNMFGLTFLVIVIFLWINLQVPFVQNWIVSTISTKLSTNLKAKVSIQYVNFSFFDKLDLKGLLVEDRRSDTLLYAGSAKVNISDWFFIKDKVTLKYASLTDAVVNMHRSDSVWNYQFLIDYFASPKKTSAKKDAVDFDLKTVLLQNIRFNKIDEWEGNNMTVSVKKLELLTDSVSLERKQINVNTLTLDEPEFSQFDYTGKKPKANPAKDSSSTQLKTTGSQSDVAGWVLNVKDIAVTNGIFNHNKETDRLPYTAIFDGAHLRFANITGHLRNIHFEKDSLTTDLVLATKERSGFEVKKLAAAVTFSPEIMEFKNLELITNKSRLGNYYAMRFKSFNKDMGDFLHSVLLEGNFVNSELNSDDLGFFAPETKKWKRVFYLNGIVRGTVDNLTARKMRIKTGNSFVDGNISLKGLPDINNTFIDFSADELRTNIADLSVIVPSLKTVQQPRLASLGNIKYKGNFTGFTHDFVAFGTFATDLGLLTGDINMKLPENGPPVYLGKISTQGFKLGEFINTKDIGVIVFSGKLSGVGFTAQRLKANFDGNIHSVEFAGYKYQNITVKGDFGKNLFSGSASVNDSNLILNYLKGSIDFSGEQLKVNFDADLAKADFKKLKLTDKEFALNGLFNLNFTGSNIDNFAGTAKISNAVLLHDAVPLSFDSLLLESFYINDAKILTLRSNNIEAQVSGKFKIDELPDAFKSFLSKYTPAYISKPSNAISEQDFSFLIKTKEVDAYTQIFDPKLKGFDNAFIKGNLKLKDNQFNVNANIPQFSYDGKVFNNIRLGSKGNLDTLIATIDVDDVQLTDSFHFPATHLSLRSHNDLTDISINTTASKTLSGASINAQVQTKSDGVKILFSPSSFFINDKKWELEKDGELVLSSKLVSASAVKFVQGTQEINITTEPSGIGNTNDIIVTLKSVSVDDLAPLAFKNPKIEGLLTGTVTLSDPFGNLYVDVDTKLEKFGLDNDSIGGVSAKATYSALTGLAKFNVAADNKENQFKIEGSVNTKDTTDSQVDIGLVSDKLDLKILNNFLNGIFSNIEGEANTSDLRVHGNAKHLSITGTANITQGSLKVIFTQCSYKFKNESVIFNPGEIDFGSITLTDTLNNTATLTGKMYHHWFNEISFDNIKLETNKLLVLNTGKKDNSTFYGKVIGKATLLLTGSAENMTMDITGEPSRTDSSQIYLRSGASVESNAIDYIDFIQFGTEMENQYKAKSSSDIVVNMVLMANPSCKIDVILDESTGDIIKGEGNGILKIRVGNKEPLTIEGRYDITKGEYTFNFQTFLKKYFTVNSGSIIWSGDPYNAEINITAEYLAKNVDFGVIASDITSVNTNTSAFNLKSDLRVVAHLKETLKKPGIEFDFELPEYSPLRSDFFIVKRLQQFQEDKNDLSKQVTSLLLFNSFTSSKQGLAPNSGYNILYGSIGSVVSSALSGYFNKFLQKYVKNTAVYLDVAPSFGGSPNDLQNNVNKIQAAAKSGLVFTLMEGRMIISVGVNLDYNNPYVNYSNSNNILITPDVTLEYIINKDGSVRVVAFNRTNADFNGQQNKTGVNLSYRKNFDALSELFNPPKKKNTHLVKKDNP